MQEDIEPLIPYQQGGGAAAAVDDFADDANSDLDTILVQLNQNVAQNSSLSRFYNLANHYRSEIGDPDKAYCHSAFDHLPRFIRALLPNGIPKSVLYTIALLFTGVSVIPIWSLSFDPSSPDVGRQWANRISSVSTNLVLSSYFMYTPIASDMRSLPTDASLKNDSLRLQSEHLSGSDYFWWLAKQSLIIGKSLAVALPASVIMAVIDANETDDPAYVAAAVFFVNLGMNYAAVKNVFTTAPPLTKKISFRNQVKKLQKAYAENLQSKTSEITYMMQRNHLDLQRFYELIDSDDPQAAQHLLFKILQLEAQGGKQWLWLKNSIKFVGAVGTAISCFGYYFATIDSIKNVFKLSDVVAYILGSGLYCVPLKLYIDVSNEVVGEIYDYSSNLFHSIAFCDRPPFKWPLSFQQNFWPMTAGMVGSLALTSLSPASSINLNNRYQNKIPLPIDLVNGITVFFVWLFNWYPFPNVISSYQKSIQLLGDNEEYIRQIRLTDFPEKVAYVITSMTPYNFLQLMTLYKNSSPYHELLLKLMFGTDSPKDIIKKSKFSTDLESWGGHVTSFYDHKQLVQPSNRKYNNFFCCCCGDRVEDGEDRILDVEMAQRHSNYAHL